MPDELKPYTVTISGTEHTMMLTKEHAERLYGDDAKPVSDKSASGDDAANKARRTRQ